VFSSFPVSISRAITIGKIGPLTVFISQLFLCFSCKEYIFVRFAPTGTQNWNQGTSVVSFSPCSSRDFLNFFRARKPRTFLWISTAARSGLMASVCRGDVNLNHYNDDEHHEKFEGIYGKNKDCEFDNEPWQQQNCSRPRWVCRLIPSVCATSNACTGRIIQLRRCARACVRRRKLRLHCRA
jgi:hypothetical protein